MKRLWEFPTILHCKRIRGTEGSHAQKPGMYPEELVESQDIEEAPDIEEAHDAKQ